TGGASRGEPVWLVMRRNPPTASRCEFPAPTSVVTPAPPSIVNESATVTSDCSVTVRLAGALSCNRKNCDCAGVANDTDCAPLPSSHVECWPDGAKLATLVVASCVKLPDTLSWPAGSSPAVLPPSNVASPVTVRTDPTPICSVPLSRVAKLPNTPCALAG